MRGPISWFSGTHLLTQHIHLLTQHIQAVAGTTGWR